MNHMATQLTVDSRTETERFADCFRLFVGQGKRYSCEAVADSTGISLRDVRAYQQGQMTPPLHKLLRLIAVLPSSFANMLLEPAGKGGVHEITPVTIDGFELQYRLASKLEVLAEQLRDGKHDHRERREFKVQALDATHDLNAFIAGVE
jgi:hypothetical protein